LKEKKERRKRKKTLEEKRKKERKERSLFSHFLSLPLLFSSFISPAVDVPGILQWRMRGRKRERGKRERGEYFFFPFENNKTRKKRQGKKL